MENSRFFRAVSRINSLLLLLLLAGGGLLFLVEVVGTSHWRNQSEVIVNDAEDGAQQQMLVGSLLHVSGHDVHYLSVESREPEGNFSSDGYATHTRNLLFLRGAEMTPHWLFKGNGQLLRTHQMLFKGSSDEDSDCETAGNRTPALALYYEVVHPRSDDDEQLDEELPWAIALSHPDGSGYVEIEQGVRKVVQRRVLEDGETLLLLLQDGRRLVMKRYSLRSFEKIAEREIALLADDAE